MVLKNSVKWGPQFTRVGTSWTGGCGQSTDCGARRERKRLALQVLHKSLDLTEVPVARRALEQCI
jgi:hypothetical protein